MKIKQKVLLLLKNNDFLRMMARYINLYLNKLKYMKYYLFNSVDDKLIVFEVFTGRKYCDSPKALYEYMLNNSKYKDYKFVWCFINPENYQFLLKNSNTTIVKIGTRDYYKNFAKAKYWFANSLLPLELKKKKKQVFLQTWHGTPLKRLRCDIECTNETINKRQDTLFTNNKDTSRFDYFISPSSFATEKFISSFDLKKLNKENIIIEKGYPRNDFLFNYSDTNIKNIKKQLGIKSNKKIILYAPTFRDNQRELGLGYTYELGIDFDKLASFFAQDYIILFRTHYFIANSFDFSKYKDFIIDVSLYDDINDLYIISDILLTDYSSVFFDFANLKRPMLFYMYDLDLYKNNLRDFYFDLDVLPGPICEQEDELIESIKNINNYWKTYKKKYEKFNQRFNYLDDKNASKRVVQEIIK